MLILVEWRTLCGRLALSLVNVPVVHLRGVGGCSTPFRVKLHTNGRHVAIIDPPHGVCSTIVWRLGKSMRKPHCVQPQIEGNIASCGWTKKEELSLPWKARNRSHHHLTLYSIMMATNCHTASLSLKLVFVAGLVKDLKCYLNISH